MSKTKLNLEKRAECLRVGLDKYLFMLSHAAPLQALHPRSSHYVTKDAPWGSKVGDG